MRRERGEEGKRKRQTSCTIGSCNSKTFQIVKPQRGLLKWERAACMRFAFEMRLLEFNKNVLLSHKKYLNILFLSLFLCNGHAPRAICISECALELCNLGRNLCPRGGGEWGGGWPNQEVHQVRFLPPVGAFCGSSASSASPCLLLLAAFSLS